MTDQMLDMPVADAALPDQAARAAVADLATYKWGFVSDIESEMAPKGLNEDTVRYISAKKAEPQWLLDWRLKAYRKWLTMEAPDWAKLDLKPIDYQDAYYYAAPKAKPTLASLDELDPEIRRTYEKLGIPIEEQKMLAGVEGARRVAVDAVFDSVSVATTFRAELEKAGVIFRSISEAVKEYPHLVRKWLGSVVPQHDNFFACLNSAVFSDGTFVYIPEGVRCPMELSTYFRINAANTGQFERTLIVADKGSHVSYLEGCTAPMRDENQLHAAVVELVAMDDAEIKYSTVQNWYPGDAKGVRRHLQFCDEARRTAAAIAPRFQLDAGRNGLRDHLEIPVAACCARRRHTRGEFYSIAVSNGYQQVDSGTKMIHLGKGIRSSRIISKGIAAGHSQNTYRGLVTVAASAEGNERQTTLHELRLAAALGRTSAARTLCPTSKLSNPSSGAFRARGDDVKDLRRPCCSTAQPARARRPKRRSHLIVNGFVQATCCSSCRWSLRWPRRRSCIGISLEGSVG